MRIVARRTARCFAIALLGVTAGAAAGHASSPSQRLDGVTLPDARLSLTYPVDWYVRTRRLDDVLDPHTLVAVASYVIPGGPAASCDGTRARGRPDDGAFVLIKEVLDDASLARSLPRLPQRPRRFHLPSAGRAGCLPPRSSVFQFRVARRAFYVFVSVGPRASLQTRRAVLRLLDTMRIARRRVASGAARVRGPWTLTALPAIGTVTWRCEPRRPGERYGLGFAAFRASATDRIVLHAGSRLVLARIVQPGDRIRLPLATTPRQRLVVTQTTEPGTLRAVVDVDFSARPVSPSHCQPYLPPKLSVRVFPR